MPYIPDYKPGGGDFRPATPSTTAAMAPGTAMGDLAKGISAVAEPIADFARLEKAEKIRKESEVRTRWSAGQGQLAREIASDPDPRNHLRRTDEFISSSRAELDAEDLPAESRENLAQEHSLFAANLRPGVAQGAADLQIRNAKAALDLEARQAMQANDHVAYSRVLDIYEANFGATAEDIVRAKKAFSKNALLLGLEKEIADNPLTAKQRLEAKDFLERSPDVTEQERHRALLMTQASIENRRGQEFQELQTALKEKKLEPEHIGAARYLTDKDRASLKKSWEAVTQPPNESVNKAWKLIDNLRKSYDDPVTGNGEYHLLFNDARANIMNLIPAEWQGEIPKVLDTMTPGDRQEGVRRASPVNGNDLLALGRATVENALLSGRLGEVSASAPVHIREISHGRARWINEEISKVFGDISKVRPEERADYIGKVNAHAQQLLDQKSKEAGCPIPAVPAAPDFSKDPLLQAPPAPATSSPAAQTKSSTPPTH